MHRVGKVDRRGAPRQGDQAALGREAEHLILEQLQLGVLQELFRRIALGQKLDGAAQPLVGAALGGEPGVDLALHALLAGLLVMGVGGDAVLGDLVHLGGADLKLDALALRPDHRGVDRAVIVLLRRRDVVLVAARHHRPAGMDDAERRVALGQGADDHAEADDVGELLEGDRLALHLRPDRERLLQPPFHVSGDAARGEPGGEVVLDALDDAAGLGRKVFEPLGDGGVDFGLQRAEREVFQLVAQLLHAHAAGERRVDVEGLLGDPCPLVVAHEVERAHVVQAIGELHQKHSHVLGHR